VSSKQKKRKHKALLSLAHLDGSTASHSQRCRSCPSPATPSLAARRRTSISSTSSHYLATAASPGPQSRIFSNPSNGPAGRRPASRTTGPVSRGSARIRLGLYVPAVGSSARPWHQGPLLAIPGHRPPLRGRHRAQAHHSAGS
jgi:hypothetical protein